MGVAGMPGTWTRLMRTLMCTFDFVVVYLDDICIFSINYGQHIEHLRAVFEVLRTHKLYARGEKCDFATDSVDFLGRVISSRGLELDPRKVKAIVNWGTPGNPKELQRFIGLAGYYRRFISDFAKIMLPLSMLMKKDAPWLWSEAQEKVFRSLKIKLHTAPIL